MPMKLPMFWRIALGAGVVGGTALGGRAVYKAVKSDAKALPAASALPISPAGLPQPGSLVAIPVPPAVQDGDVLHTAARSALTALGSAAGTKSVVPAVQSFQASYNASNPPVKLKADGLYGAKTQAALQSVMGSALAPVAAAITSAAKAAAPAIPAPQPLPNTDVSAAATALAGLVSIPKSADRRVSTFQHVYNLTPGVLHLVEDGKYGGTTQGAVQSVLDWLGTGLQAPKNPFGPVVQASPLAYSGPTGVTIELG